MILLSFLALQISLKEGYQPTKTEMKVSAPKSKPKPSLLDKPTGKLSKDLSKENSPSPPSSPNPAVNAAMTAKLEEFASELSKMKAIILKHEVRIRELEKKNASLENNVQANNNGDSNLLPDEV
jgi:hypothetical protein